MQMYKAKHLSNEKSSLLSKRLASLFILLLLPLSIMAQLNANITIDNSYITLKEAFRAIETQTGYHFAYNVSKIDTSRKVFVSLRNMDIDSAINSVLRNTGYTYKTNGNHIIILQQEETVFEEEIMEFNDEDDQEDLLNFYLITEDIKVDTLTEDVVLTSVEDSLLSQNIGNTEDIEQPLPCPPTYIPAWVVKNNLLYSGLLTLNLGIGARLNKKYSLDISINYNPWTFSENRKFKFINFQPEIRYWFCETFSKHYLGIHLDYARFNISDIKFPLDIFPGLKNNRYQGDLYGGGITYGYQWYIAPRWSMEANVGAGYFYTDYDKYPSAKCEEIIGKGSKHYIGITKLGVSIIYIIK